MAKYSFASEEEFSKAWNQGHDRLPPRSHEDSGHIEPEPFYAAGEAIGRGMKANGFRLFRNGGLPKLERRMDSILQELLLNPGPQTIRNSYVPVSITVHVSHEGMKEVRERYWLTGSRTPLAVASGPLSLLEDPPSWVIWDVADGGRTLQDLADWVVSLSTAWFDHFDSLDELKEDILKAPIPMLSQADALELVLAEQGRSQAKRFLREMIPFGGDLSVDQPALTRVDERAPLQSRLDAIATTYRLR